MAVYTDVAPEALMTFWQDYDLPELRGFSGISEGTENSNFRVESACGPYILTLFEKRTNPEDLPFFMELMRHLSAQGVVCPQPMTSRTGKMIGQLCGRPAVITSFLQGMSLRRWLPVHCYALGAALARLHVASQGFSSGRRNILSLPGWQGLFALCAQADQVRDGLHAHLQAELDFLAAHWPQDAALPRGVIHADLFPDNVFFTGEQVSGLIDFYFACTDFYAYDVAICLNAWCFEDHVAFNITKAQQFLRGYTSIRPFTPAERQALPLLCRGASLRFLLTRLYDVLHPKGGVPRDPLDYFKRLVFHQQVEGVTGYGLSA